MGCLPAMRWELIHTRKLGSHYLGGGDPHFVSEVAISLCHNDKGTLQAPIQICHLVSPEGEKTGKHHVRIFHISKLANPTGNVYVFSKKFSKNFLSLNFPPIFLFLFKHVHMIFFVGKPLNVLRNSFFIFSTARYKAVYETGPGKGDWSVAKGFYKKALLLNKGSGVLFSILFPAHTNIVVPGLGHNQMAVLASYEMDDFEAMYHHYRSLATKKAFPSARENLINLFNRNNLKLMSDGGKKVPHFLCCDR